MAVTVKSCGVCREAKPLSQFHRNGQSRDGRHPWCASCKNAKSASYYQRWTEEQRIRHRKRVLRFRHGIESSVVEKLYEDQQGRCAICSRPGIAPFSIDGGKPSDSLQVDHDHATGEIRGLLCFKCNTGLGKLGEDTDRLRRAIRYLRRGGQ